MIVLRLIALMKHSPLINLIYSTSISPMLDNLENLSKASHTLLVRLKKALRLEINSTTNILITQMSITRLLGKALEIKLTQL